MKITQIIQDTREQAGKHRNIERFMRQRGVQIIREANGVGDYTLPLNRSIVVDVKADIVEIAGNICGNDHTRFRDECIRAQERGARLIVLIEEDTVYNNQGDEWRAPQWHSVKICQPEDLTWWSSPTYKYDMHRHMYVGIEPYNIGVKLSPSQYKKCIAKDEQPTAYEKKKVIWRKKGDPITTVKGETIAKAMRTMETKYGVQFLFCNPEDTGKLILQLLGEREND